MVRRADTQQASPRGPSGCRLAAGVLLIAVGIPMLILPGPGLLAIGAGIALIAAPRSVSVPTTDSPKRALPADKPRES